MERAQFTLDKVVSCCGLRYIAEFSENRSQVARWLATAREVGTYVTKHCLNYESAIATIAGAEAENVSSVLFPTWGSQLMRLN